MFLQEVILENFMSYEYARVPLKSGVNEVCGPNGAGKSSILLGISVALGQSYTERSRKLSDLIRRGKDQARVTLILDNSRKDGRRPVQRIEKDQIFLTRVVRRDGKYWFELDNKAATKQDVERLLSKLGVDPDNMLIIMHQNMTEQFTVLSPQEKLRMVEAAVGFESYRRNVLDAQRKLSRVLSEEESVSKLLDSAEQTLSYWREQYDRYQQKKQLIMKRRFLERELGWAQVAKKEKVVNDLKNEISEKQEEFKRVENEAEAVEGKLKGLQTELSRAKEEWNTILKQRLGLEREKAQQESRLALIGETLKETQSWLESRQDAVKSYLSKLDRFESSISGVSGVADLRAQVSGIRKAYEQIEEGWTQQLSGKGESLKQQMEESSPELSKLDDEIATTDSLMNKMDDQVTKTSQTLVDDKIRLALLENRKENLQKDIRKFDRELRAATEELEKEKNRARESGPQVAVLKSIDEILDEMRLNDGYVAALTDVSEDVERMYESYSKLYLELKDKAQLVAESREKALVEVRTRMDSWRTVIRSLLDHVNVQYQTILANAQAEGEVRLVSEQDIEAAGLQIFVGFKGARPVPLDAYTQSGGERSTATMTFLLALQQHVRSQFRAVDEYDIHMDPKNREIIARMIVASIGSADSQYLVITPSQITFADRSINLITVQNIEGTSLVKEVH